MGAGISVVASTIGAAQQWEEHDFDAFAGSVTEVAAGGIVLYGTYLLLIGAAAAPGLILVGTIIGLGAAVFTALVDDNVYDRLFKFSAFGKEFGADVAADTWALCDNFQQWDPQKNPGGLALQLRGAEQLLHAFTVRGITPPGPNFASTAAFEIEPSVMVPGSQFFVEIEIGYYPSNALPPDEVPLTKTTLQIKLDAASPALSGLSVSVSHSDEFFDPEEMRVSLIPEAKPRTIQLVLPLGPKAVQRRKELAGPLSIHTALFKVRQDVHGDGTEQALGGDGTLVVPNSASGQRFVYAMTMKRGRETHEVFKSYDDQHIKP